MSSTTPEKEKYIQLESSPDALQNEKKVCVNLTQEYSQYDNNMTLTGNEQEIAYKTDLEPNNVYDGGNKEHTPISSIHVKDINGIREMERLREQLQCMLNPVPLSKEYSPNILNISSTSSIDTIALLRSALPESSPELQMDENGILISSANSNMFMKVSHHISVLDSSIVAENTILKENIEKERFRRKHCEEHIHELQDKLLECQEQLAVAISAEKKKEVMINQLDKSDHAEQEKLSLKKQIEELQNANLTMEKEKGQILKAKQSLMGKEFILQEKNDLLKILEKNTAELKLENKHLEDKMAQEERDYKDRIVDLKSCLEKVQKEIEELQSALSVKEQENHHLMIELHTVQKEKKTQAMELTLLKSKFDALKTTQDSETRWYLEKEFNMQIFEIQKQIACTENDLRQAQKKKINELLEQHRKNLEEQKHRFQSDIKRKDELLVQKQVEYDNMLNHAENRISELTTAERLWHSQRGELMNRIKSMEQQWKETISLLNNKDIPALQRNSDQLSSTLQSELLSTDHIQHPPKHIPDWHQSTRSINARVHENYSQLGAFHDDHMFLKSLMIPSEQNTSIQSHFENLLKCFNSDPGRHIDRAKLPAQDQLKSISAVLPENNSQQNIRQPNIRDSESFPTLLQCSVNDMHSKNKSFRDPQTYHQGQFKHVSDQLTDDTHLKSDRCIDWLKKAPPNNPYVSHRRPQAKVPSKNRFSEQKLAQNIQAEHPISLLYQDLDDSQATGQTAVQHKIEQQAEKQTRLTHFIEKLLQRSPGQPLEDNKLIRTSFQHVIPEDVDHLSLRNQNAFQKTVVKDLFDSSTNEVRSNPQRLNSDQTAQLKPLLKQERGVDTEHVLSLLKHNYSKTEQSCPVSLEKLEKVYGGHCRKSTKSSEAKQVRKKSFKSPKLNKNVASKEYRRVSKAQQQSVASTSSNAWK
ncbi:restin homolog isoform X4 [Hydractinia symbiolongicarpus]|uniref:restin homolog isoform X4 n=1 Tax=Hydractinia symbiolongicarpus TaxID=13093 RepID=UPI00254A4979|nr:restin homolog isoform X4 [Hydractinia symbiolongicarpus]